MRLPQIAAWPQCRLHWCQRRCDDHDARSFALNRVSQFLRELRRRRVFRTAGLYVVGAWVLLQVAALAFDSFGIPETSLRYVWIALVLGTPLVLVFG